ncbi:nuclear transport factor 2 family protein [Nakamurella lactea]|uniref:nuclear transport factor 2 family protein n=1 Tax=Nakamurella lactea TaxID=459515 RepID=UPI000420025B|nr:nuclear transport factor 2 family protein [Nakamurella lactea]
MTDLVERIDRLESAEQIRQLAARYPVALDSRNVADLAALFVSDVKVGDGRVGRSALAQWYDPILRPYGITIHFVGNHVIDFTGPDTATGLVYCRPEHQVGDQWIVMPVVYHDRYQREADGNWYFRSRKPKPFYAADVQQNPLQVPGRFNFPDNPYITAASLPESWPSWQEFWSREAVGEQPGQVEQSAQPGQIDNDNSSDEETS